MGTDVTGALQTGLPAERDKEVSPLGLRSLIFRLLAEWEKLSHTDTVIVIGGGWSVTQHDTQRLPGLVIGVNEAGVLLPCHVVVSMDRLWTEHRWDLLASQGKPAAIRRAALKKVNWLLVQQLCVFECNHKTSVFATTDNQLNGTNSGGCAMNLAYLLKPKRVFMLGFDMTRGPNDEPYWHPPHPWNKVGATKPGKYNEWAREFDTMALYFRAQGTEVINASSRSRIKSFRTIGPKEFRRML